jgi:hypothetical protein
MHQALDTPLRAEHADIDNTQAQEAVGCAAARSRNCPAKFDIVRLQLGI